jgi:hypothetical protein
VPAGMQLLGSRNWYLPGWLAWIPDAHLEGGAEHTPDVGPAAPGPATTS